MQDLQGPVGSVCLIWSCRLELHVQTLLVVVLWFVCWFIFVTVSWFIFVTVVYSNLIVNWLIVDYPEYGLSCLLKDFINIGQCLLVCSV